MYMTIFEWFIQTPKLKSALVVPVGWTMWTLWDALADA